MGNAYTLYIQSAIYQIWLQLSNLYKQAIRAIAEVVVHFRTYWQVPFHTASETMYRHLPELRKFKKMSWNKTSFFNTLYLEPVAKMILIETIRKKKQKKQRKSGTIKTSVIFKIFLYSPESTIKIVLKFGFPLLLHSGIYIRVSKEMNSKEWITPGFPAITSQWLWFAMLLDHFFIVSVYFIIILLQ